MMATMKQVALFLILSVSVLPPCHGGSDGLHHFEATEWDVISPLTDPCITSRGWFGRQAKYEAEVHYQYELTLREGPYLDDAFILQARAGGSSTAGLQGVFSAIETGIANALLDSTVFDSVCSGGEVIGPYRRAAGGGGRQLRNGERQLRAVGISSNPQDQILEGLTCSAFVNATDGPCVVVDGQFMIYMDIFEDLDASISKILSDLMNEHQILDDAHPYIQKVRYVHLTADLAPGSIEEETEGVNPQGNTTNLSSGVYALIAAGTFLVVGTAVFYRRRRSAAEHDGETTTLDQTAQQT